MSAIFGVALAFGCIVVSPAVAETHAVVVGVNDYINVPRLLGAVADAKDISTTLKKAGVVDLVTLLDAAATRKDVLGAIDHVIARAHKDDLVIITFAGHGGRETWGNVHPPGTTAGEQHEIFLLRNITLPNADGKADPKLGGSAGERIFGVEMATRLKRLDDMGTRTIFVADTCHGGGLTREPVFGASSAPETERFVAGTFSYAEGSDPLSPTIAALPAPINTDKELRALSFLAAVDRVHKAPEVDIPKGSGNKRGALSYAFARVIEGRALPNGKTNLTHGELLSYVIASIKNSVLDSGKGQEPDLRPRDGFDRVAIRFGSDLQLGTSLPAVAQVAATVKMFVKNAKPVDATTRPELGFALEPAANATQADLVFDPASGDVFSRGGDLIATKIAEVDLEGVAEREVAIRRLVELAKTRARPLRLDHGDRRYMDGDRMSLDARRPEGELQTPEYYLLVIISGNGKVQFQYPLDRDSKVLPIDRSLDGMAATEPFGADYAVFVSDTKPLDNLIEAVRALANSRSPNAVVNVIERSLTPTMRIGLQGIYTAPKRILMNPELHD